MSSGKAPYTPLTKPIQPAASPAGSGEGAQSALAAMIKKRQSRAQQDDTLPDPAPAPATRAQQPPASKPEAPAK
jgi:hypothetical protein